jgi:molybdenum cofactor cytidylyltransferase
LIYGILLAAGSSSRFGSDKLLYPLAPLTPLGGVAARNLAAGVDRVVAVVRPGAGRLKEVLMAAGVTEFVVCPEAALGLGRSLAGGIRSTPQATGWLIALADMPFIRPATIRGIAQLLRRGSPLAAPVYEGRRGHPIGFSREFGPALSSLTGDRGAQTIVQSQLERLKCLACDDPGVVWDVDVPGDLPDDMLTGPCLRADGVSSAYPLMGEEPLKRFTGP